MDEFDTIFEEPDQAPDGPTDEDGDELPPGPRGHYVVNVMGDSHHGYPVHVKAVVTTYEDAMLVLSRLCEDFEERQIRPRTTDARRSDRAETSAKPFSPGRSPSPRQKDWEPDEDGSVPCGIAGCKGRIKDWYDKDTGELRMSAVQIARMHTKKFGGPRCYIHRQER